MFLVWFRKYQKFGGVVLLLLLTFAAGWQLGRVMSPYYAAHPIVFQETAGQPSPDLQALQAKSSVVPEPSIAAATTTAPTLNQGKYVGSVNSDLYHDPSCPSASRIKVANQVWFASREEAEKAGYSPSACTKEKLAL